MNINVLLKLSELKKQEINSFRKDFKTLENIVIELDGKLTAQEANIQDFIQYCESNEQYRKNPSSMLNRLIFLQRLDSENKNLKKSKVEAEIQMNAAFESLKESALELRKLIKVIAKEHCFQAKALSSSEILINDTLEMYRHNDKAKQ